MLTDNFIQFLGMCACQHSLANDIKSRFSFHMYYSFCHINVSYRNWHEIVHINQYFGYTVILMTFSASSKTLNLICMVGLLPDFLYITCLPCIIWVHQHSQYIIPKSCRIKLLLFLYWYVVKSFFPPNLCDLSHLIGPCWN